MDKLFKKIDERFRYEQLQYKKDSTDYEELKLLRYHVSKLSNIYEETKSGQLLLTVDPDLEPFCKKDFKYWQRSFAKGFMKKFNVDRPKFLEHYSFIEATECFLKGYEFGFRMGYVQKDVDNKMGGLNDDRIKTL
jgi:hypothetical protein